MALTYKQQRFVDEYCIDQNATQAYKRAGYKVKSERVAHACAAKLLRNATIRAAIDDRLAKLAEATRMSATESWREVACIARASIKNFLDVTGANPKTLPANQISDEAWKSLKSVKVKRYLEGTGDDAREVEVIEYTLWPKLDANALVLKAHGELKDKVEHTGKDGDKTEAEIDFIDVRAKILSYASVFREAARRNLQEAAEAAENNGHTHDGSKTEGEAPDEERPGEETPRADDDPGGDGS